MQIIIDIKGEGGPVVTRHIFETSPGDQPQVSHPKLDALPVDAIHFLKALHDGTIPTAGTGWDLPTEHPSYPGQTRLQACIAEIVRLDDKEARKVLGL